MGAVVVVAALAAVSALRGGEAPETPPPRGADSATTAGAPTVADTPLAALADVPAALAQVVVIAVDDGCRATQRTLGSPAFDRALDLGGLEPCDAAWSRSGRFVAAPDYPSAVPSVLVLDRATGVVRRRAVRGIDDWPRVEPAIAVADDGRVAVCVHGLPMRVLGEPGEIDGCAPTFAGGRLVYIGRGGVADDRGALLVRWRALGGMTVHAIGVGGDTVVLAADVDGDLVLIRARGGLVDARLDLGSDAGAAAAPGSVETRLAVAPDGASAFLRLGPRALAVRFDTGEVVERADGVPLVAVAYAPQGGSAVVVTGTSAFLADAATLRPQARIAWGDGTARVIWPAPAG